MRIRHLIFFLCTVPAFAQTHSHLQDFKRKLIWKGPLAKTAVSALFNEVRNSPHEWGRGVDGFAKRAGSSFGQRAVKASVELGASEWTHEDLHYHRLGTGSFFTRLKHAVVTTYWVPRDNGPGNTIAMGRVAGIRFAAPQVARLWMPDRVATLRRSHRRAPRLLSASTSGINVLYEFWRRPH